MKKFKWPWQAQEEREAERKALRSFEVPEEHLAEVFRLWDKWQNSDTAILGGYELWKYISDLFPPVKIGPWHLKKNSYLSISVREKTKEDWEN